MLQVVKLTAKKDGPTREVFYYITNLSDTRPLRELLQELDTAAREHWSLKSNNWSRDTLMREDLVKVKSGPQALAMAVLRSIVLRLLQPAEASLPRVTQRLAHNPELCKERLRHLGAT